MGQCTIGRARIILSPDDTINEKYSNWVHQNTSNTSVGNIVVEAINSGKFTEHFKDNPKFQMAVEKGLLKMNGNTFKGFVREYERQEIPSVKATATKTQGEIKGNFSSEEAKRTALNYTADITVDIYHKLLYKVGAKKLNTNNGREFIKTSIQNRILDSLYNRDIDYCNITKNNEVKKNLEKYYKEFKQANSAINNLAKKIALSKTKQEIDKYTEFRNEAIEAKQIAVEQILAISSDLYKNDLNSEKNQNYTVLATEVFTDSWFDEVRKLPKVFDIQDILKENTEANKANAQPKYDEYNIETILSEEDIASIDSSTANWNDSLYNDFIQHFDGRIRLYLNNLYKLRSINKTDDGQYIYYTENELGVPETMGAAYIIAQISTFGNFNSVNDFINSIVNIANNIPGLEGLIKLADDMKADRVFANMVASNLAKPAIIKNMIIYDGEAFKVIHSNPNAYASTQIFNRLKSVGKITISQEYDDSISSKVKNYIESINNIKNSENFIELRSEIGKFILAYFNKYFTGINPDIISDYYYTTNNLYKLSRAKELLNIIKEYNERLVDINQQINKENSRVYNANKAFKQQLANTLGVAEYKNIPLSSKQREVFNPDNINYDKIDLPIAKLANILAEHMPSSVDLNSGNAENNMSSDIIKNSYLTNFLKQLNDILDRNDGTQDERGLKLLKEFYGKSSYFDHSPILYGIKVGNTYIREGLFRKNSNGQITISPNARNLINIILFNGIKNINVRTGQLYQNMSSSDYLTSIIASYFNPLNYNYKYAEGVKDYCQVLLRIPSDASNQYAVQMPKYRFDDFYTYDENATKNFIYDKLVTPYFSLKGIEEDFTKKVSDAINNDGKLEVIFDKHKANFISTQEAAEILYNGGINGVLSLYPYKKLHNGKILPLVVKDSKNNNSFIIYLKSSDATYKAGKDFKVISVVSLNTTKKEVYNPLYMMNLEENVRKDIGEVLTNYFNNNVKDINSIAFKYKGTVRNYNKNSAIYLGFKQHIAADINRMFNAINDVFEEITDENGIIHHVTKTNTDNLFDNYHYKRSIVDSETGKLTGQVFAINKLFNINNYNVQDIIEKAIPLYGNDGLFVLRKDGRLEVNLNRTDLINEDLTPNYDNILAKFDNILQNWLNEYTLYINEEISRYSLVNQYYSENQIHEAIFNQTLAYMDFDDLFEGSSKFYKDAQTFLKRDKEIQAGGSAYMGGVDLSDSISAPIHDMRGSDGSILQIQILKQDKTKSTIPVHNYNGDGVLTARNGFRAVTIKNTVTTFDVANDIYNKVKERLVQEGQNEEIAKDIAKNIADGYGFSGTKTKANDAQSYITIEEFIRRKWMDGTLTDYGDLLDKLLDENYELTPQDYANISSKIQVQKNFYYDIAFDDNSGIYYPRQIKNAEFVLIPRFIKGSELEQLYNIMKENDINQINTVETSKAANINTLEFWDNKGIANNDKFKQQLKDIPNAIQTYYYRYLYKQQDVVDHIENEENKAGIQILKKIQDNIVDTKAIVEAQLEKEIAGIKQDAINDGTFMKAPNGKLTNLTEKQWLQVRTKAFKDWFGDWESVAKQKFGKWGAYNKTRASYDGVIVSGQEFDADMAPDGGIRAIIVENEQIGEIPTIETPDRITMSGSIGAATQIIEPLRGKGYGKKAHIALALIAANDGKTLYSDSSNSDAEDALWKSLVKDGLAEVIEEKPKTGNWNHTTYRIINSALPQGEVHGYDENVSKVVDENGEPLVVYHNSPNKFTIFDIDKSGDIESGFFFSTDKQYTKQFGKNEYPAFINIRKPVVTDVPLVHKEIYKALMSYKGEFKGMDGIIGHDKVEDRLTPSNGTEYMIYKANQIKSATDNSGLFSKNDNNIYDTITNKAAEAANTIQNLLVENIKEDYNKLLEECGWTTDNKGNIINKNGGDDLNFDEFYRKARREAARLGMDENFLDYITPASNGRPSMPTFMNNVSNKLESIAQAVFNTSIIRQTLPGFHAVQVTNVGYSRKLKYEVTDEGITAEIMVAPWNDEIKEIIRKYGKDEARKQLEIIGADEFIGYRIPTEGKQSIVKMKVVDFLDDSQGSTIIVPNEWVAQSGSDFDVDTIYSIVHELQLSNEVIGTDENNRTQKTFLNIKDEGRAKRNNEILEAFKTILSDSSSFEENASRSNYDDITKSKNKYNVERGLTTSVYDVFTEVRFMQNAIDGRKLKAFSVNRDTFASISNKVHGILHQDYGIKVKYDLSKYNKELIEQGYNIETSDENTVTVNHRTLGWSKNNRNVVGKLITPYTSQTTAHILDAIKEGVVFNETDYTFGVFKTLIDLGVDYDTAVSFLAQAPITDLNNEYFKVNSAFTSSYKTIIENVDRAFAKRYGFILNGEAIKDSASVKDVLDAIAGNKDFVDKYKEYWGVDNINEIPALDETKFAKNINDASNPYHYFGVLQIFNHLKQVTDVIEDIANCSRPDATGARQTVRATRKLLDNIEQYSIDQNHSILYSDGGGGFLKELYGFSGDVKNINVQKAKYPYLAAMLKYGISTSVDVNKRLFLTASDKFNAFVNRFETRIGKELNEDEYNAFKKYYVSSLYAGLEFINSPIVLNKFGNIISNPDYSKYGPQFWETEKGRVFGYIEPAENGDFFEVADFANPTEEELNKYLLLTPLQKVLFLTKALPYDDNIFNKLYINKTSDRNYKEKGYTNNKISINTNNSNIESLYQQFSDAFFNENPLIRLAAIDLVKYSFFVEGFNYKNGAISKIIPNKVLYTEVNANGMNIIEALNKSFNIQLEKDDIYFSRFIRSHSDILTSLNIPVPATSNKPQNIGNILNQYREKVNTLQSDNSIKEEYTGYISIPVNNSTVDLLKYLRLDTNQKAVKYIKLNSTIEPNSKRKTSLYEVRPILSYGILGKEYITQFNLIPLNLLEENEWGEESINYQNNTFYTEQFYREQHTETVNPVDFIIPRYYRQVQTFENRESIETIIAEGTGNSVELAKRAKNQIIKWYNEGRKIQGGENFGLIQLKGALVNTVLGINKEASSKESIQDIVVDDAGTILTVKIIPTHQYDKSIKNLKEGKKARISQYVQDFALNNPDFYYSKVDEENLGIYRIVPVYEATKEELEQSAQEKAQENSSEEKYSAFSGVLDHINSMTNGIKRVEETHDISALIMKELQYQKNHGNTGVADAIKLLSIKGFVPNDSEKLENYKVDIYKIAAKYYRDKADDILKQLDNFVCNGEIYKVDDDALYDALREEPERVNNLYRLILEASTFGNQIPGILDLQMTGEDKETSDNIARIQRAIKDVKNNPKIHKAFTNVYNIYLAKEYATNPYVKLGIVAMTDIFGDSDWFAANIGDVTHLNHKQIQVVTKIATTELEKARLRAKDELVAFDKWWTEMEHKLGADNMQKVLKKLIDEKGQFIQPYIQKFIDDKENWKEKLNTAEKFGKTSIEYLKIKHDRDKWYMENTVQPYIQEYYEERWKNEDYILRTAPKAYSEYLTIEQEYYNLDKYAILNDAQKLRKRQLAEKMQDMRTNEFLNGFLTKRADINDKYFEWIESEEFRKTLNKYKDILDSYVKQNPTLTMWDMYTNPDVGFDKYRDAYDWIRTNCIYTFDDEAKHQIYDAFATLKRSDDRTKRGIVKILNKVNPEDRYDIAHQIIGTKYTLEDARAIKAITEQKYNPYGEIDKNGNLVVSPYNENVEAYDSDANLIKNVPQTPILTEEFFLKYFLADDERTPETRKLKRKYYTYINNIIKRGINKDGDISAELLVQNCTIDELKTLANLYKELRLINKKANTTYEQDNSEDTKNKEKKPFEFKTNHPALLKQKLYIENASGEIRSILEDIFYEKNKEGRTIYKGKIPLGNKYIYGYVDLAKDATGEYTSEAKKYIDQKKTDARKLIDDNVEFVETEYYWKAWKDAEARGENAFNEWYEANHVYNPYKHKWEPITIWTSMRAKPTGNLKLHADYIGNKSNTTKTPRKDAEVGYDSNNNKIKKDVKNPKYDDNIGLEYNGSETYKNPIYYGLTETEQEVLEKLQKIARKYAINNFQKGFLNKGFAPRVYEKETDFVDTLNDVANVFGLGKRNYMDKDWHSVVDFEHDFDAEFSMYKLLKAKGYKEPPKRPVQAVNESDTAYQQRLDDWKAEVKKINADNLALDNSVFSRNWKDVYRRLIQEGEEYIAKDKMKDLLYLTLEDLRNRDAYALSNRNKFFGDIIKNKGTSTIQQESYYTTSQSATADTFQNWIRRYLFDEYKKYNKGTKIADRIQTMNSSKFMMFNLMSGINNVNVGVLNMIMEGNAGNYFSNSQLRKGMAQYTMNVAGFVNNFINDEVSNEIVALSELFNIEDYDRIQSPFQDFKSNAVDKFNSAAYAFLSSGEHFMRNSAMLAMLESHKIYEDPNNKGKYVVGTLSDYKQSIEIAAIDATLKQFINESGEDSAFYRSLHDLFYQVYIPRIRNNKREAMKFDRLQKDIINDFIRSDIFKSATKNQSIERRKKFIDAYLTTKKALNSKAEEDFAKFETVRQQLEFNRDEKREVIKANSKLTQDHIADLINKAKSVNKKIHGVYDKLGAAKIERGLLGGLIMQYKKHLYPGFMKHWRRRGYYNEHRGTYEYGSIQSLLDFLTTDFRYKGSINDHWAESQIGSDEQETQKSIQGIFKMFINNSIDLGINWQLLPDWQKQNIVRLGADLGGAMIALLVIMAIYGLVDDDDLKESKALNEILYLADRLYGEATMYDIGLLSNGLWTEFSNFKDKPIVAMDYIYDGYKMWNYFTQWATNPDYEPNYKRGTYKGENKMWVTLRKNIPAYRQWQQIQHITAHNTYYKVNENNFMQTLFKNIGLAVRGSNTHNDKDPFYSLNR